MSDVYYRYFRVTSGPLVDEIDRLTAENKAAQKHWFEFINEIGATSASISVRGTPVFFEFDQQPDKAHWKAKGLGYLPKRNTRLGRQLHKRMRQLPPMLPLDHALNAVGLDGAVPVLIDVNCGYTCNLMGRRGVWFVTIPWRDVPQAELDKYRAARSSRVRYNMSLDYLQWTPPPEFTEIKEWQYLREWDELNHLEQTA